LTRSGSEAETGASDAVGFVLAGGRSSRMGTDKATVGFRGQPLVVHALRILREAGLTASIAGARSPLEDIAPLVQDREPDRGPLGGITAALASSTLRYAVFISVDMPLLPPSLIAFLLDTARGSRAAVTMTSLKGFAQTFPVVMDRAVLPHLLGELEAGRCGCFSALQSAAIALCEALVVLPAESIVLPGSAEHIGRRPVENWFLNLNSPADMERAEAFSVDEIA